MYKQLEICNESPHNTDAGKDKPACSGMQTENALRNLTHQRARAFTRERTKYGVISFYRKTHCGLQLNARSMCRMPREPGSPQSGRHANKEFRTSGMWHEICLTKANMYEYQTNLLVDNRVAHVTLLASTHNASMRNHTTHAS